ncbi:MAG: MATE family efflux transporter [Clostridia bacterium]|nr:MATE family efflux transporter [Clostridia bacterium]
MTTTKQQQKHIYMTETPIPRLIIRLAIPAIISMLISSIYNMADTFFIGQLKDGSAAATSATAAVGVAFPLMSIIQAIGFMFGHGSGNFISRALGSQKTEEAGRMAATGFFSALLAGVLLSVIGLVLLEPLCRLLGSTDTILPYAMNYIRIILIGAPWMCASLVLNNQLRFQGNAFFSMIGISTGGVINIALDPLFIFTFHMGISGAALATIISQFISFVLLFIGTRKSDNLNIHIRNFTPKKHYFQEIFKGGAPSLFRQGIGSLSTTCLNNIAKAVVDLSIADPTIAALSIVSRIMMFANSLVIGFGQGFQPVCGFNYGAGKHSRVREAFYFCVKLGTCVLIAAAIAGLCFAPSIISLFRADDAQVIEIGALALRLQCITMPLFAYVVLSNMMLQTIAKTFRASLLAVARQGLFFLPILLVLAYTSGLFGIQLTQPIADVFSFLLALILMRKTMQEINISESP